MSSFLFFIIYFIKQSMLALEPNPRPLFLTFSPQPPSLNYE